MLTTTTEHLTRLMAWLSPTFPIGGYTYSHGIEYAVESGHVLNRADLVRWVEAILKHGAGRTDTVLFAAAYRAVKAADEAALIWAAERADVLRGSSELALESTAQGTAFLSTVSNTWPPEGLGRWTAVLGATGRPPTTPSRWPLSRPAPGYRWRWPSGASCMLSPPISCRRGCGFVPLGQTDGQRAIAELDPIIHQAASRALNARLEDLGGCAPMIDWAAMSHESQYTRLFHSYQSIENPAPDAVPIVRSHTGPVRVGIGGPVGPARPRWSGRCASACATPGTWPPSPTTSIPGRMPSS